MDVIPCQRNPELELKIEEFAEALKTQAHSLGGHGLSEDEFYQSGLFRGAIERIRGQFSATMSGKRDFVKRVLNFMQDRGFLQDWEPAGDANRHDYRVTLNSGRTGVIEIKGCLDGNNTTIFERPDHAEEFILWSLCTNPGANPRHNVWSGIHTRLSAEIIARRKQVDGLIVWDMLCATVERPCPKLIGSHDRLTEVGPFRVPPPCIYVFPPTIPSPRNNPAPVARRLADVELLSAFNDCFGDIPSEINYVDFEVQNRGPETLRTTRIRRNGAIVRESAATPLRRA